MTAPDLLPAGLIDPGRPRLRLARPLARQAKPWYRISAKAEADSDDGDGDTTVIDIYDEIGWFGIGAADFVHDLRGVKTPNIDLHINSPGGDVFDAIAIFNALRQHKAQVHVLIDSLAASAASFIAMAGDRITAMANAMLMIHDPHGLVIGNAADMRDLADLLDKHGDNIAAIYAARAGGTVADWRERMLAETWYLADEAKEAGLVDEVNDEDGREVSDAWDLSVFTRPVPERPAATATPDPEPDQELDPEPADDAPEDAPPASTAAATSDSSRRRSYLGGPADWYLPHPREEYP